MNTTNITEEIGNQYIKKQSLVKLSGVEGDISTETVMVQGESLEDGVALELSDEGKQKAVEMQNMKRWAEQMKEEQENASEYADDTVKIMTIFRRIANGDIVPPKDENKLMEHSMEMYQAAKNLSSMKQNDERKKYKSVDDEEEDEGAVSQEEAIRALSESSSEDVKVDVSFE